MSRINLWTVIAILLVLFAVTRYLMHERETSPICQRPFRPGVGVTITTIQNWERGRHAISAKRFGPLADALYCQPLDLLMLPRADVGVQKIMGYSKSNP